MISVIIMIVTNTVNIIFFNYFIIMSLLWRVYIFLLSSLLLQDIHGWGAFAGEDIPKDSFIAEYTGKYHINNYLYYINTITCI